MFDGIRDSGVPLPNPIDTDPEAWEWRYEVWRAAISVVGHNLSIGAGTNRERGEIQAEGGTSRLLPGEAAVGVFIRPANTPSEQYMVEVVSRKRGVASLTGKNWEQTIIDGLKAELKL